MTERVKIEGTVYVATDVSSFQIMKSIDTLTYTVGGIGVIGLIIMGVFVYLYWKRKQ